MADAPALVTLSVWGMSAGSAVSLMAGSLPQRRALARARGVRFVKVLGTAAGGSMGPADADPRHWAVLVAWDDEDSAGQLDRSRLAGAFDARAYERLTVRMRPLASRGRWGGRDPFGEAPLSPAGARHAGPVAALTRARLAPTRLRRFHRAAGVVANDLSRRDGLLLALGVGEAPVGLQGTFSVWRSGADLTAFAYGGAAHAAVVRRTPAERWYTEELFARFAVLDVTGRYDGRAVC